MEKADVVRILRDIAVLLELKGENPFKSRSYETAARSIESASQDLDALVSTGGLYELKGVGEAIGKKVVELAQSGRLAYYEELCEAVPVGLLDMTRIPGFGPKKARAVWQQLGIEGLNELEQAALDGRLVPLPGFGAKSVQNILEGIAFLRRNQGRWHISTAREQAQPILEALRELKAVKRIEVGGSLRRWRETIRDIDMVVSTTRSKEVMEAFVAAPSVQSVVAHGETKSSVTLQAGINCDLRSVSDAQYPFALQYFTGSKEHNVALRQRARSMGLKLNEYGLFRGESPTSARCKDEAGIFKALRLAYIPPELREDMGEIEAAEAGTLPALIEPGDLRGMIHFHTTASDGHASLEDMARQCERRGYRYIGVCDHSQSAAYANGLRPDDIKRQHDEVERVQEKFPRLRILKGIESDILAAGELDYPESMLRSFDFVVVSVHSRFSMARADMTRRIVAAVENPYATILGHPTGRLLLQRDPYELDLEAVLEAAGRARVAIEINAHPQRLDLDWRHCRAAKKLGCFFLISPDAHSPEGIDDTIYGVGVARKGWLTKNDVINCLEAEAFVAWKRGGAAPKRGKR